METLKFDERFIPAILDGRKTLTTRNYNQAKNKGLLDQVTALATDANGKPFAQIRIEGVWEGYLSVLTSSSEEAWVKSMLKSMGDSWTTFEDYVSDLRKNYVGDHVMFIYFEVIENLQDKEVDNATA